MCIFCQTFQHNTGRMCGKCQTVRFVSYCGNMSTYNLGWQPACPSRSKEKWTLLYQSMYTVTIIIIPFSECSLYWESRLMSLLEEWVDHNHFDHIRNDRTSIITPRGQPCNLDGSQESSVSYTLWTNFKSFRFFFFILWSIYIIEGKNNLTVFFSVD